MSPNPQVSRTRPRRGRKIVPLVGWLTLWFAGSDTSPVVQAAAKEGPYLGPCALQVSSDAKTLYVACADAQQVAWVELSRGHVIRRVNVPAEPTGMAQTPDGTQLIVTCAAAKSTVAVLDAVSGNQIASIPAGHTAMSPVVSPDGKRVYVCNRFAGNISVIDLAAGVEVARVPADREPIAAAITPDGQLLLVASHLPNTRTDGAFRGDVAPVVTMVNTRTLETTAIKLLHGANGVRGLCVTPDGKHALVTHLLSNFQEVPFRVETGWINVNVVSIIDTQQRKLVSTIGLDQFHLGAGNPYHVIGTADGRSVCVSQAGTHQLCIIDRAELLSEFARRTMQPMMGAWPIYVGLGDSLWKRIKLPGRGPRGLAAAGSKIYVALYFSDTVAVVDLQTADGPSVRTIALGGPTELTARRRGQLLFHDATICYQHWQSCASCHPDGRTDGLNWDLMNDGAGNPKNTKSMLLAHQTPPSMAEGVRASADLAVRAGLAHILFSERPEEEAVAIDTYLKSLRPVPSPHLVDGRLSGAAERGRELFHSDRIGCHRCHPPPQYTDLRMHQVEARGPYARSARIDTPTLVEVWRTAPYLYDGRYITVHELLVDGKHGLRRGLLDDLSQPEINDLVEFVLSL